jgi:hypothetical protein
MGHYKVALAVRASHSLLVRRSPAEQARTRVRSVLWGSTNRYETPRLMRSSLRRRNLASSSAAVRADVHLCCDRWQTA